MYVFGNGLEIGALMNCKTCQSELPELLLSGSQGSAGVRAHLASCEVCSAELVALEKTFALLDAWQAPEPSAYFDQKLAVRLREEQARPAASWLERIRERLLFNTGRQFRPAMAGALALVIVLGGGTFAGITEFSQPTQAVAASPAVDDLQILDKNEQAIQQMDQLLDDDGGDNSPAVQPAS